MERDRHYKNNGVRTFEAITGFVFNVVFEYVNREKVEIWKTDDESEYANKIVNEGGNRVIIHIGEGTSASTKVFNKGTDGKWTEDNGAPTLEKGNSEGESSGTDRSSGGTTTANGGTGSDISKSARLASVESDDAGLVSVSSGEAGEEGSTSGGDASLASTDASPEGSVATPANEVSTSGGSSGEGAGADAAENLTAQPAGGDDAGSLRRGSTRSSGSDSHVKGEPADGTSSQNSKSTQNVHEKKQKAKAFFTDLNKVVNELSQEIDGTNDLAELDSKMREAGYKLSVKLSEFLKLL
ncbi:hypothetical protein MACK_003902 [Theileria orientalis]|uniref:Uncharacterized protein n=1 Tax=Theileria orientalis TaxID=68886 RepID=A0A976SJ41_THEOR|nr:hypothetical protein MACK_003902 [Theileria orientalis]